MKYFVVGLIIGVSIILLGERGFLANILPAASVNGITVAPAAAAAASGSGGCACGCNQAASILAVPAEPNPPSSPVPGAAVSAPGQFGGNPSYVAPAASTQSTAYLGGNIPV